MAAPWSKIRAEWLKGGITQKELAEKYGVNLKTLQNRASNEGWKNQKGIIREKTEEELRGRIVRARVNHLERLITANEKIINGLEKLAGMIEEKPELFFDKTKGLRNAESVTRALQTATMTQRDLYRIPNIDQKFAAKKWKEQQKLEREKIAEKTEDNGQQLIWVINEPAAEEGDQDG